MIHEKQVTQHALVDVELHFGFEYVDEDLVIAQYRNLRMNSLNVRVNGEGIRVV